MRRVWLLALLFAASPRVALASEHFGQVTFSEVPVPGATVTASQGEKQAVTITDQQGVYRFADLGEGLWTFRVEMLGFQPISRDVTVAADATADSFQLALRPFEEMLGQVDRAPASEQASATPAATATNAAPAPGAAAGNDTPTAPADSSQAADGFLINGSVNNGAASPFAQLAAFGNNRRAGRSLYNFGLGVVVGNSVFDARPFSFTSLPTAKPGYNDLQMLGTFAGPVKLPYVRNKPNVFVGYQRTSDHSAVTQSALMPTLLERDGDFSQTLDPSGRPVQIVDPQTGMPFPANVIPPERISPQAAALLALYPGPNLDATGRYNYQTPVVTVTRQDSLQTRLTHTPNGRNQLFATLAYQRTTTDAASLFAFVDSTRVSGIDTSVNWFHRFSQFLSIRLKYQFTRLATHVTPNFSGRTNVSGLAGITGGSPDEVDWGPPNLIFSSGVAGLSSAQYASNRNRTHAWTTESSWSHGRHYVTFGGDIRRLQVDIQSQQDARGTFSFTGAATGSDLADFLLGVPQTSAIAFGNADKYLRAFSYDAYVTDDWRVSPALTVNAGLRWEYESPFTERFGRLVNLDIAPGFADATAVQASDPTGAVTGTRYPDSLVRPDKRGLQPRIGIALRPIPGSSLVIRAGYGIYRNTNVYQPIALLLSQQPPLSTAFSVENSASNPLRLADGLIAPRSELPNTFAVDPNFRVGFAQNWQLLVQRDLPASLTMIATYLGTKGSHLMQAFLPNTYPAGAVNPCPACPAGFVYLTSNGSSLRQSAQFQLRRRLRNGLTASAQYTLSKATDDAGAFSGVALSGSAIAQDWRNLEAERGPSNFDQRHQLAAQVEYTTGVGVSGGALLNGLKGMLLKGWTFTSQMTAGSGLPLTPVYLTSVAGTGVTGSIRPDVAGSPTDGVSGGLYVNPAAFAAPAAGTWGNAGRNSIRGPRQFSLNMGVARTFLLGDRLNLDWRIDATNVLNRVTYASINTIIGSPQFGLPNRANQMRKVQSTLRLRF